VVLIDVELHEVVSLKNGRECLVVADSVEKLEWRSLGHIRRGGQTIPWAAIVDPGSI